MTLRVHMGCYNMVFYTFMGLYMVFCMGSHVGCYVAYGGLQEGHGCGVSETLSESFCRGEP